MFELMGQSFDVVLENLAQAEKKGRKKEEERAITVT